MVTRAEHQGRTTIESARARLAAASAQRPQPRSSASTVDAAEKPPAAARRASRGRPAHLLVAVHAPREALLVAAAEAAAGAGDARLEALVADGLRQGSQHSPSAGASQAGPRRDRQHRDARQARGKRRRPPQRGRHSRWQQGVGHGACTDLVEVLDELHPQLRLDLRAEGRRERPFAERGRGANLSAAAPISGAPRPSASPRRVSQPWLLRVGLVRRLQARRSLARAGGAARAGTTAMLSRGCELGARAQRGGCVARYVTPPCRVPSLPPSPA